MLVCWHENSPGHSFSFWGVTLLPLCNGNLTAAGFSGVLWHWFEDHVKLFLQLPPREQNKPQHTTPSLISLVTLWPQRIELCLHYDTLPFPPSRVSRPSLPVLAEDSLFFTVYPMPTMWLHLFLWAEMKASGSDVYIWLRGRPLRASQDKTTLPSSLCPPYSPSSSPPSIHSSSSRFLKPFCAPYTFQVKSVQFIKYSLWSFSHFRASKHNEQLKQARGWGDSFPFSPSALQHCYVQSFETFATSLHFQSHSFMFTTSGRLKSGYMYMLWQNVCPLHSFLIDRCKNVLL